MSWCKVTDLQCRPLPDDPRKLDLISCGSSSGFRSGSLKAFDVHTLAVQDVQSWNVCHIRPGSYWRYFKRHACEVLTLRFPQSEDVEMFTTSLVALQAEAMGILPRSPRSPPSNSRSISFPRPPSHPATSTLGRRSVADPVIPPVVDEFSAPSVDSSMSAPANDTATSQQAPTIYQDPPWPVAPTVPARLPTWRTVSSQDTRNFVDKTEDGGRGPEGDDRSTGLRTSPERFALEFTPEFRAVSHPSRRGWHSSTVSQAGSQGGWRSFFRSQ